MPWVHKKSGHSVVARCPRTNRVLLPSDFGSCHHHLQDTLPGGPPVLSTGKTKLNIGLTNVQILGQSGYQVRVSTTRCLS